MKKLIALAAVAALALILAPAASAQMYVKNGGYVGIGDFATTDPLQPLHVKQPGNPVFKFQSTTTGADWNFKIDANGNFAVSKVGTAAEMILLGIPGKPNGVVLDINGKIEADDVVPPSSREYKQGFEPMDPSAVLEKVAEMPITRWSYKSDPGASEHIGPMAEDFHAAFATGAGDKNLSLIDANGVAFAAIQGLYQQAQQKDQLIAELLSRIEKLEQTLASR